MTGRNIGLIALTKTAQLPDSLTRQLRERQIPETEIQRVALAALEIRLAQEGATNGGRFAESAIPFVRRLITQNCALFETLAQR
jgi:hypothetical protein